jgi:hypothetical protein
LNEEAFLQGLRAHEWIEGQNAVIGRRYWENRAGRLAALADELIRLKVNIIVASTGTAFFAMTIADRDTWLPIMWLFSV